MRNASVKRFCSAGSPDPAGSRTEGRLFGAGLLTPPGAGPKVVCSARVSALTPPGAGPKVSLLRSVLEGTNALGIRADPEHGRPSVGPIGGVMRPPPNRSHALAGASGWYAQASQPLIAREQTSPPETVSSGW